MARSLIFIFCFIFISSSFSNEIVVCKTCSYKNIKEAVKNARDNDVVIVKPGTYLEDNILIKKKIHLKGEKFPIIDIEKKESGFLVEGEGIIIEGFVIKNSGFKSVEDLASIKIINSKNITIRNNKLYNNTFGVYLDNTIESTIENNEIKGTDISENNSGNGIHLFSSKKINVHGNKTEGNRDGIYLEFTHHSDIKKNISFRNMRYGLHYMYSNENHYEENEFYHNDSGVAVMYSKKVTMIKNYFHHNTGPTSYGLLLKDINESKILENVFEKNTSGLFMDNTTRSDILRNKIISNGTALKALGNNNDNRIMTNSFYKNTYDVVTNAFQNENVMINNYWDRYAGLDLNKDGIGDTPHYPVLFTSYLTQRYPISLLLLDSFFFALLDKIEGSLPILTPENFKDPMPLYESKI